jgi:hypothetical protein
MTATSGQVGVADVNVRQQGTWSSGDYAVVVVLGILGLDHSRDARRETSAVGYELAPILRRRKAEFAQRTRSHRTLAAWGSRPSKALDSKRRN